MRIGIDARLIEWPGIGRYINELINNLIDDSQNCEFIIYFDSKSNVEKYGIEKANVVNIVFSQPVFSITEQIFWPFRIKKDKLSVFHVPHYAIPLICSSPRIVTIHDMVGFRYPQYLFSFMAKIYYQWMTRFSMMLSSEIIVDSEFTKQEAIDILSIKEDKIHVVYLGVNQSSFQINKTDGNKIRRNKQLPENYFLYLGTKKPWKNLEMLLQAYKGYLDSGYSTKLVLAGKDAKHQQDISLRIKELNLENSVIDIGEVDESDLVTIYQGAVAFLFPSYYEGFGLPVLEAMALGVPVIASNAASIPEVVGDAGILVDPANTNELTDAMIKVVCQEDVRVKMQELGFENVKRFNWQACAINTMKVYKKHVSR